MKLKFAENDRKSWIKTKTNKMFFQRWIVCEMEFAWENEIRNDCVRCVISFYQLQSFNEPEFDTS